MLCLWVTGPCPVLLEYSLSHLHQSSMTWTRSAGLGLAEFLPLLEGWTIGTAFPMFTLSPPVIDIVAYAIAVMDWLSSKASCRYCLVFCDICVLSHSWVRGLWAEAYPLCCVWKPSVLRSAGLWAWGPESSAPRPSGKGHVQPRLRPRWQRHFLHLWAGPNHLARRRLPGAQVRIFRAVLVLSCWAVVPRLGVSICSRLLVAWLM